MHCMKYQKENTAHEHQNKSLLLATPNWNVGYNLTPFQNAQGS